MQNDQRIEVILKNELIEKVTLKKSQHKRLVQIHCMYKDNKYEISYSFDSNDEGHENLGMENLRLIIGEEEEIESVDKIYPYAFIYENEMKDLFGIKIANISLDFKGKFYKLAMQTPFKQKEEKK